MFLYLLRCSSSGIQQKEPVHFAASAVNSNQLLEKHAMPFAIHNLQLAACHVQRASCNLAIWSRLPLPKIEVTCAMRTTASALQLRNAPWRQLECDFSWSSLRAVAPPLPPSLSLCYSTTAAIVSFSISQTTGCACSRFHPSTFTGTQPSAWLE